MQNLPISGLSFQQCAPSTDTIGNKADFAVLIVLNEHPDSNSYVRKNQDSFYTWLSKIDMMFATKTSHFL